MSKIEQALKDGYQAIAQQFGLYRLLDRYQALLVKHQPHDWQSDYYTVSKIKKSIEIATKTTEGYTDGGLLTDLDKIELLQTSCTYLFKQGDD